MTWFATNWLALAALVVAVAALGVAVIPIRQGQAARRTASEIHDVTWDWQWAKPGVLLLENESHACTAHKVSTRIEVDGELVRQTADVVGPGNQLTLLFPRAAETWQEEVEALKFAKRPLNKTTFDRFGPDQSWRVEFERNSELSAAERALWSHHITWRVDWATPLGTPKVAEERTNAINLAPS